MEYPDFGSFCDKESVSQFLLSEGFPQSLIDILNIPERLIETIEDGEYAWYGSNTKAPVQGLPLRDTDEFPDDLIYYLSLHETTYRYYVVLIDRDRRIAYRGIYGSLIEGDGASCKAVEDDIRNLVYASFEHRKTWKFKFIVGDMSSNYYTI